MLIDTSMKVVLEMPFLIFSNANIWFAKKEFKWRRYLTIEALPIIWRVKLINKREFAAAALDENTETFVIRVAALLIPTMQVHLSYQVQLGLLLTNKTFTKIMSEYSNYADVFSFNHAIELLKNISINEHAIKLIEGRQPLYRLIYSLKLVELEILKTYIETYLKSEFI